MEPEILIALQNIHTVLSSIDGSIKVIGGLIFGSMLFVHFGRFMRW